MVIFCNQLPKAQKYLQFGQLAAEDAVARHGAGSRADAPEQHTRNKSSGRARDEPAEEADADEGDVDRSSGAIAETHRDGCSRDAVGGRHGDADARGDHHDQHGATLDREATRG